MTALNAEATIASAIDSLLAQTFGDFELIVVDDGSTDRSADIVRGYGDSRIRLYAMPHRLGRTPALRFAFDQGHGEFVAILDADDISFPSRLAHQVSYLDRHPDVVLVGTRFDTLLPDGTVGEVEEFATAPDGVLETMTWTNPIAHSTAMFRKAAAAAVGGYPADFAYAQDFALWLELARVGKVAILPECLTRLRVSTTGMTLGTDYRVTQVWEAARLFRRASRLPGLTRRARAQAIEIYTDRALACVTLAAREQSRLAAAALLLRILVRFPIMVLAGVRLREALCAIARRPHR